MANIAVSHTAARGSIPRIGITFFFLVSIYHHLYFLVIFGEFLFILLLACLFYLALSFIFLEYNLYEYLVAVLD